MRFVVAAIRLVEGGLRVAAALCLFAMFALVIMQVALRYTGGGIPVFTDEAARYAMIWSALFATAVAVRENSHIHIDLLPALLRALAPALALALAFVLDVISVGVFGVLFWQGIGAVTFAVGQRSEGLQISLAWPYAALPVAFGFALLFALARLVLRDRLA